MGACEQTTNSAKTSTNSISKVISLDTSSFAIISFDNSVQWLFDGTSKASYLNESDMLETEELLTKVLQIMILNLIQHPQKE